MANLNAGANRSQRGDRGQIILIAAFTLAVAFVALALVVNSAIFTENLASRGEVAGSSEALLYQHEVRESVGAAMDFANVHNYSNPEASVEESLWEIGTQGGTQQVLDGRIGNVTMSATGHQDGYRFADNVSGGSTFRNESGFSDWKLAGDVEDVRNFQIQIASGSALGSASGSALAFEANDSGTDIWELRLYQDGDLVVEVDHPGTTTKTCEYPLSSGGHVIDVTGGTVDGNRCHALSRTGTGGDPMWWATDVGGPYQVWIKNGHNVRGNYSLIAGPDSVSPESDNLAGGPNSGRPFETDALYSARAEYVYATPQVVYEAELRVAPGEVPS